MLDWIIDIDKYVWHLTGLSIITFFVSALLVPIVVIRLPSNYFSRERRSFHDETEYSRMMLLLSAGKNLFGILFILLGVAMLVLPGQGILTITAGLILTNFPGKFRVERWFIGKPSVLHTFNWIRKKANKAPLIMKSDIHHD